MGAILLPLLVSRRIVWVLLLVSRPRHYEVGRHEGIAVVSLVLQVVIATPIRCSDKSDSGWGSTSTRAETMQPRPRIVSDV